MATITPSDVAELLAANDSPLPVLIVRGDDVMVVDEQHVRPNDVYVTNQDAVRRWQDIADNAGLSGATEETFVRVLNDRLVARAGRTLLTIVEWGEATGLDPQSIRQALYRPGLRGTPPTARHIAGARVYGLELPRWMHRIDQVVADRQGETEELDRRIVELLAAGRTQAGAAEELGVPLRRVWTRLEAMRARTGLSTRELVSCAATDPPPDDGK